jgi:riboflavin biosynthesis pyrimidine reductase
VIVDDLRNRYNVQHLMIEGGPITVQQFIRSQQVDRLILVRAKTVTFASPYPSNFTTSFFQEVGNLVYHGEYISGDDTIECWTRPSFDWPTSVLEHWP